MMEAVKVTKFWMYFEGSPNMCTDERIEETGQVMPQCFWPEQLEGWTGP